MKKLKESPNFKTEDEEREFWSKNDSTTFVDWEKEKTIILPNIPTTNTLSINSDK